MIVSHFFILSKADQELSYTKAKRMHIRVILGLWDMKSVCLVVVMFPSKVDDKIF